MKYENIGPVRLQKESIPADLRKKAWEGRKNKAQFMLPTGAKVWFVVGRGYFGYGYHYNGSDITPYIKESK